MGGLLVAIGAGLASGAPPCEAPGILRIVAEREPPGEPPCAAAYPECRADVELGWDHAPPRWRKTCTYEAYPTGEGISGAAEREALSLTGATVLAWNAGCVGGRAGVEALLQQTYPRLFLARPHLRERTPRLTVWALSEAGEGWEVSRPGERRPVLPDGRLPREICRPLVPRPSGRDLRPDTAVVIATCTPEQPPPPVQSDCIDFQWDREVVIGDARTVGRRDSSLPIPDRLTDVELPELQLADLIGDPELTTCAAPWAPIPQGVLSVELALPGGGGRCATTLEAMDPAGALRAWASARLSLPRGHDEPAARALMPAERVWTHLWAQPDVVEALVEASDEGASGSRRVPLARVERVLQRQVGRAIRAEIPAAVGEAARDLRQAVRRVGDTLATLEAVSARLSPALTELATWTEPDVQAAVRLDCVLRERLRGLPPADEAAREAGEAARRALAGALEAVADHAAARRGVAPRGALAEARHEALAKVGARCGERRDRARAALEAIPDAPRDIDDGLLSAVAEAREAVAEAEACRAALAPAADELAQVTSELVAVTEAGPGVRRALGAALEEGRGWLREQSWWGWRFPPVSWWFGSDPANPERCR